MDWELAFWLVALVVTVVYTVYTMGKSQDLYYEGDLNKIGGKGGRQFTHFARALSQQMLTENF